MIPGAVHRKEEEQKGGNDGLPTGLNEVFHILGLSFLRTCSAAVNLRKYILTRMTEIRAS